MIPLAALDLSLIARTLLGAPDPARSTASRLIFPQYSVDLQRGRIYDEEAEGFVALPAFVARLRHVDEGEAEAWIEGLTAPKPNGVNGHHDEAPPDLPDELAAERALIGLILLKPDVLKFAEEEVAASDFISPLHAAVFSIFFDAREQDYRADIKTVVAALTGDGFEAPRGYTLQTYVARLAASAPFAGAESADDQARALARDIREYAEVERGKEPEPESTAPPPFQSKFGGRRWEEIGRRAEPYPWVVENIVPGGESVVVYGASGSGKSFNSLDIALSVARGLKFNGLNVDQGLVIYVAAEAGKGFDKRKLAYCTHHGLRLGDPLPFYLLTKRANLFKDDTDTNALIEEIRGVAAQYPVPLRAIFLDTVSALTPGMNENASQDVSKVRERIDRIKDTFSVATILVHHTPKGGGTPRGHGSFTADFETTIYFETVDDFYDDQGRPIHRATIAKQREGKRGFKWEFVIDSVEVGKNKWGNPETSGVVIPRQEERVASAPGRITDQQKRFMLALFRALDDHGIAPAAANLALPRSILKAVDYKHVKTIFARGELNDGDDPRDHAVRLRQALSRARKDLASRQFIGVDNPYVWATGRPIDGMPSVTAPVTERDAAPAPPESDPEADQLFRNP